MPQPKPRDSWVHWEGNIFAEVGLWQEKKRLYIVIFSCRTKGVSRGEHLRRLGQRKTERDESWALQLSEETKQYTREIITAGKHTPTTGNKKVNIAWVLSVFPSLFFGVCAGMAVCVFRSMYECVYQGSCVCVGRFVTGGSGCRQKQATSKHCVTYCIWDLVRDVEGV